MNKLLLRLVMLPSGLWKGMGADPSQLQALLDVKLKLDDRKPLNFGRQRETNKPRRFSSVLSMFVSFITGLIYILPLIFMRDRLLGFTIYFTVFLFLLTFTLITDFSSVLVDTRDKHIVLPRPVNDRTLLLSRLLHIFVYLFRIVLPMSIPGWITVGALSGWTAALWFPLPVLLLVFTALFLVMGAYLLMLRLAPAERFKDILGYIQIAFSVVIFAFYYLAPRAMNNDQFATLKMADFGWARLSPSYWLAATWSWIHYHAVPSGTIYYSLLAILLPAVALWVTIRFFAPSFTAKLGGMDAIESSGNGKIKTTGIGRIYQPIAVVFNRREEARAGFILAWLQTARSRSFKLKIYPMFAYVPIYFLYIMLNNKRPLKEVWATLPESSKHLMLLYMSSVVVLQALSLMTTSEQHKASWIYYAAPVSEPGAVMSGAFKAMWVKYFLPFFITISAFVLVIWGVSSISDILLALVNVTLFAVAVTLVGNRKLPFSELDQVNAAGSRFLRVMLSMIILGILGVGHYLAIRFHMMWLKVAILVLSSILLWLVWDSYAKTKWSDMKTAGA